MTFQVAHDIYNFLYYCSMSMFHIRIRQWKIQRRIMYVLLAARAFSILISNFHLFIIIFSIVTFIFFFFFLSGRCLSRPHCPSHFTIPVFATLKASICKCLKGSLSGKRCRDRPAPMSQARDVLT